MFKILIIDPNTFFREALGKIIRDHLPDVEIQEAGSGAEGFGKVRPLAPQLIFIDIYLPDMNGFELAKKINRSDPEITVAIFLSLDSPEYRLAAAQCGVKHLIPKDDWTGEDILALVESALSGTEISSRINAQNENSAG